jgi:hypothetical protein
VTQQHPITPPPELVQELRLKSPWSSKVREHYDYIIQRAAQWGADQELEACCEWIPKWTPWDADQLRAHRRPQPPSLKGQALVALHAVAAGANDMREQRQDLETIRLALEQLDD